MTKTQSLAALSPAQRMKQLEGEVLLLQIKLADSQPLPAAAIDAQADAIAEVEVRCAALQRVVALGLDRHRVRHAQARRELRGELRR